MAFLRFLYFAVVARAENCRFPMRTIVLPRRDGGHIIRHSQRQRIDGRVVRFSRANATAILFGRRQTALCILSSGAGMAIKPRSCRFGNLAISAASASQLCRRIPGLLCSSLMLILNQHVDGGGMSAGRCSLRRAAILEVVDGMTPVKMFGHEAALLDCSGQWGGATAASTPRSPESSGFSPPFLNIVFAKRDGLRPSLLRCNSQVFRFTDCKQRNFFWARPQRCGGGCEFCPGPVRVMRNIVHIPRMSYGTGK